MKPGIVVAGSGALAGVSEILAVDRDRLLVLERSGKKQADGRFTFHCRLSLADFRRVRDVSGVRVNEGSPGVAIKRLLVDFERMQPKGLGNLEAMAWWPGHGGRWLLMANDDNFADSVARRLILVTLPEDQALR